MRDIGTLRKLVDGWLETYALNTRRSYARAFWHPTGRTEAIRRVEEVAIRSAMKYFERQGFEWPGRAPGELPPARSAKRPRVLEVGAAEELARRCVVCRVLLVSGLRRAELSRGKVETTPAGVVISTIVKGGRAVKKRIPDDLEKDAIDVCRLSEFQIYRAVREAGEAIGLGKISPHWLRHAHAQIADRAGFRLHEISHSLGHRSGATTMIYLGAARADVGEAIFTAVKQGER